MKYLKYLKLFETWKDNNLDIILDKISKDGIDSISKKDKDFITDWFPNKTYKQELGEYENEYFKIILKDVEYSGEFMVFYVKLFSNKDIYEGEIHIKDGRLYILDLFDVETGESFESSDDIYKIDDIIDDIIGDYPQIQK